MCKIFARPYARLVARRGTIHRALRYDAYDKHSLTES
jgi:hypothetical protein